MKTILVWWHSMKNILNTQKSHRMERYRFYGHKSEKPIRQWWQCECGYGAPNDL